MNGPDTKYKMMWRGDWRAVTNMLDSSNNETTLVLHATKAVLFVAKGQWVAVVVNPGEIVTRTDRDPKNREWEYVDY